MGTAAEGKRIRIRGTVQGVGFRPWVYRVAVQAGVRGRVRNDASGVTIDAFGNEQALDAFEQALHQSPPPAARIAEFDAVAIPAEPVTSFVIEHSEAADTRRVSIPPDLAICDDCVADILDPANRRYRYPFTNCTNCGPRFTIATDVPYDRSATTMAPFEMCGPCRREYEDVGDRRFHAQPTACPVCGPQLSVVWDGREGQEGQERRVRQEGLEGRDPIDVAAGALRRGLIVGVKGIGGFHLACDATSDAAVTRLRERKHRDQKPLAVMVRTLDDAEVLGELTGAHRALLSSPERPIVLVDRKADAPLAESIAPGNRQLGLMLPYSPLHHLLLTDAARPLVMTSGNLSDEPIAFTNADALARLGGIADLLLLHDREIHTRCDDSVVAIIAGAPTPMRRSRGYVPNAVTLARPLAMPVLATGALLKNTFCLASGTQAFLGPHIGDLENLETYDSFMSGIELFQRFVGIRPEVVACDMHPDYLSTIYAQGRSEPVIAVQHHHAHVVSAMAEHGLTGPVIGLAYDGTGFGTDGTSWGGEVLMATAHDFERLATFRAVALVGGDRAVHEPWRVALALLLDAYDGIVPPAVDGLMRSVPLSERATMLLLLRNQVQVSLARGVGRYFDAWGALFLNRPRAAFEGQVALEWNQVADPGCRRCYPFDIDERRSPMEVDLRPALRAAVSDAVGGVWAREIAAAFHNTLATATAAVVARAARRVGRLPVVATGGCFMNARLAESVRAALAGFDVRLHRQVPSGDGGIALGQAVVADAVSRA